MDCKKKTCNRIIPENNMRFADYDGSALCNDCHTDLTFFMNNHPEYDSKRFYWLNSQLLHFQKGGSLISFDKIQSICDELHFMGDQQRKIEIKWIKDG